MKLTNLKKKSLYYTHKLEKYQFISDFISDINFAVQVYIQNRKKTQIFQRLKKVFF